jgi:arylsulfatase A-like enzyme
MTSVARGSQHEASRIALARALVAACALACAACSRARPRLVVWIEVDTLRADALGCYGNARVGENGAKASPNIDALAEGGVRFERAYTAAPWTIPSLVTQLSGLWPWEHGDVRLLEPVAPVHTPLVPILRERGWRTAGVMTNFIAKSEYGFANGFERWDETLARGHEGSTSHEALARLLELGDELRGDAGSRGVFLFAWLFEPHYRYEAHEGLRFGPGFGDRASMAYPGPLRGDEELDDLLRRRHELTALDAEFLRGRYQSEVAYLDRSVGELVSGLKARGLYDDALIVFTSDHGEEILDRDWIGHSVTLHEELVHVPLIVHLPRGLADARRGAVVSDGVSLIDLPATLVDLMTGSEPDRARGDLAHSRSLAPTLVKGERPARRHLYLHTNFEPVLANENSRDKAAHQWGVIDVDRDLKWIVDHKVPFGAEPRPSLFDLAHDPLEHTNLAGTVGGLQAALPLELLRGLVPVRLDGRRPAPRLLPEEPWIHADADTDGVGPAWPTRPR